MENKRKLFFAIVAFAMLFNIGYGVVNNGIPIPFVSSSFDLIDQDDNVRSISVPELLNGAIYRTNYNLSMEIDPSDEGSEGGSYKMGGISTRSIVDDRISKDLSGTYSATYHLNETEEITLKGDLERNTEMIFNGDGEPLDEKVETLISIQGPKGIGSSSRITSKNSKVTSIRSDMIWQPLIPFDRIISEDLNGSISAELNLQEAGFSAGDVVVVYEAISFNEDISGSTIKVRGFADIGTSGTLEMDVVFKDGYSWPISVVINIMGEFITEEGPAEVDVVMNEVLGDRSEGSGTALPLMVFSNLGPDIGDQTSNDIMTMPAEGGDTAYRSSPQEVFDHCIDSGELLNDLIDENGLSSLSLIDLEYSRYDEMDRMWLWNVSVAAPPVDGISDTVNFVMGVEGGGLIDKTRLSLLSESYKRSFRFPEPGRSMISLNDHEDILKSSEMNDKFFNGDDHTQNYGLDIVRRGGNQGDISSVLFMNMLGVEKAQVQDLYISRAVDITDPTIMYLLVVNGNDGSTISSATIEGAAVTLLNTYGYDLA